MRIEQYLRQSARSYGDKIALVAGCRRLSYAELDDLSDRLATSLITQGLTPGERAVIFMDNGWEAAVSVFAVLKAGAVFCPVNPSAKAARLAFILRNCGASVILAQGRLGAVVADATSGLPNLRQVILTNPHSALAGAVDFSAALEPEPAGLPLGLADNDLAMVIYTSGSTGEPKGVMMAHSNMDAASGSIVAYLENKPDDIILNVLPMAFGYGLYQLLTSVRVGATLVLEKSFAFPQAISERIRDEKVTGFPLVPPMIAMLLQMRDLDPGLFASLRYTTSAAAALPVAHLERFRAFLPHVRFYSMYGQTECTRATWLPPEELDRRPASVGVAIPGTNAFVVDAEGCPAAAGETGELVVIGPHVMRGYWGDDAATARALVRDPDTGEIRLHTGDLFTADEDGFLTFIARKDDIIKSRGEKVAPKEVEAVLHTLPGVAEAIVVGVPDPVMGQAIKALVVKSDPALTERDVMRHCARNLEDFMVPKFVEFRTSLPKTDTGKLSRRMAAESSGQTLTGKQP